MSSVYCPPSNATNSALTILMTCWSGERLARTSCPKAWLLIRSTKSLTTRKLTSASRRARRTSRRASSIFFSVNLPWPRKRRKTASSFSLRDSNMVIRRGWRVPKLFPHIERWAESQSICLVGEGSRGLERGKRVTFLRNSTLEPPPERCPESADGRTAAASRGYSRILPAAAGIERERERCCALPPLCGLTPAVDVYIPAGVAVPGVAASINVARTGADPIPAVEVEDVPAQTVARPGHR